MSISNSVIFRWHYSVLSVSFGSIDNLSIIWFHNFIRQIYVTVMISIKLLRIVTKCCKQEELVVTHEGCNKQCPWPTTDQLTAHLRWPNYLCKQKMFYKIVNSASILSQIGITLIASGRPGYTHNTLSFWA